MTMGKFLLAIAMLVMSLPAQAAEIPAKYHGEWCDHISGNYYMRYHPSQCKRRGIGYARVTRTAYELGFDDLSTFCRVVSVKAMAAAHIITFNCVADLDDRQTLTIRFGTSPSRMGRGIRLYAEPLDDDRR
jgi:hypothetical protein